MLPRKFRAKRVDIEETIKTGKTLPAEYLYAKISRSDMEKAYFTIIVTKKVEKTSVGRHLIKRKISALLESELPKMSPNFKKVIIFFIKKTQNPINFDRMKKDMKEILNSSGFFV